MFQDGHAGGDRLIDLINSARHSTDKAESALGECPAAARQYLIHAASRMTAAAERLALVTADAPDNVIPLRRPFIRPVL